MPHLLCLLLACAGRSPSPVESPSAGLQVQGVTIVGGAHDGQVLDVLVVDGLITAIGPDLAGEGAVRGEGLFLAPAFIDSHVHLAYLPQSAELAAGGVAAAIDLAAPLDFLAQEHGALRVLASGPMITAEGGYPTRSWGAAGYGLECADAAQAAEAVQSLHAQGARLLKLPVTSAPVLSEEALRAAVEAAHGLGLPVLSHALSDSEAALARAVGVDLLAHTPTEPLSEPTLSAWAEGAVVSTLRAFGGSADTVENLRALRAAGATVLYGTDFGNTRTPGIDLAELELLVQAGLSPAEVLAAGTSVPASTWGLSELGAVEVGKAASFLLLREDPRRQVEAWASVEGVWIGGERQAP